MLIGYNNDVQYRGKTFHIQTEDHGVDDPQIETQLFHSGAILDTRMTSYASILEDYEGEEQAERIKALMKASHKSLYKKLFAGEYDELAGLEPKAQEPVEEAEDFTPSQDRVPAAAAKIEEEGEDAIMAFQKEKAQQHVDLSTLKSQLSKMDGAEESEPEVEPDMDTQIMSGSEISVISEATQSPASQSTVDRARVAPAASAEGATTTLVDVSQFERTGASAWQGCDEPGEDLSIVALVEAHLAS